MERWEATLDRWHRITIKAIVLALTVLAGAAVVLMALQHLLG